MLVLHDETALRHRTVEMFGSKLRDALECPQRIEAILKALENDSNHVVRLVNSTTNISGEASETLLQRLISESHDAGYIEHLRSVHSRWVAGGIIKEDESVLPECFHVSGLSKHLGPPTDLFARPGYYAFDLSTGIGKDTWASALASANLAVEAARATIVPESPNTTPHRDVLALCRPPGHHCTTKLAGGYCYLNNAVITVQALRHYATLPGHSEFAQPLKIAIMDLDFHHGNGTQSYFYGDPCVLYVSIHGEHEYPYYTGYEDETGEGHGEGYNLNLPLAVMSSVDKYLEKLDVAIQKVQGFNPEFLIVSLGFDTFYLDPLGAFDLKTDDYQTIARKARGADGLNGIPSLVLLEGGYVLEDLGQNMLQFLKGWESGVPE